MRIDSNAEPLLRQRESGPRHIAELLPYVLLQYETFDGSVSDIPEPKQVVPRSTQVVRKQRELVLKY